MSNMPAGRELDTLVAERVMGWSPPRKPDQYTWQAPSGWRGGVEQIPAYSTSIAAAWEVVDKLAESGKLCCLTIDKLGFPGEEWRVFFQWDVSDDRMEMPYADAPTAPHAICLAALAAVEAAP